MKLKKHLRKPTAWLLTLVMLFGMLPVSATQAHLHDAHSDGEAAALYEETRRIYMDETGLRGALLIEVAFYDAQGNELSAAYTSIDSVLGYYEVPVSAVRCKAATTDMGSSDGYTDIPANADTLNFGNGLFWTCSHDGKSDGICSICGECDPATLVGDYYQITKASDLFWFAKHVNEVDREANAILMADIDLQGRPWTPIGSTGETKHNFRGHFDGNGKTVRGLNVQGNKNGLGFFGEVRLGTVEDFTIYGKVEVLGACGYIGGVIGSAPGANSDKPDHNGATIRNITSYVDVTLKENAHGASRIGGFIGYANHESLIENCAWYGTLDCGTFRGQDGIGGFIGKIQNGSDVTIRNCAAYGTLKSNYAKGSHLSGSGAPYNNIYMGGFLSYSAAEARSVLENCLFAGKIERGANLTDEAKISVFGSIDSYSSISNCYTVEGYDLVASDSPNTLGDAQLAAASSEKLSSGEVAYKLGSAWGQSIGTDAYPVLGGAAVYAVSCGGTGVVYSNSNAALEHNYVSGVCTNCGAAEPVVSTGSLSVRLKNYMYGADCYGAYAAVYKNGALLQKVELTDTRDYTWECPNFDDTAAYNVYWHKGSKDYTLLCQVNFNGERVYFVQGMGSSLDGQLLFTTCTDHTYVDGACSKCGTACLHPVTSVSPTNQCGDCGLSVPSEIAFGTSAGDYTAGRGSLVDVVRYFKNNGGTYYAKLLGDVTLANYVDIDGANVTLDLAGFDITAPNSDAFYVRDNGVLTVDDSTEVDGTIKAGGSSNDGIVGAATAGNVCTVNILGGNIVSEQNRAITGPSTLNVSGGSLSGGSFVAGDTVTVTGGSFTVDGGGWLISATTLKITGGSFSGGSFKVSYPGDIDMSEYTGSFEGLTLYVTKAGSALDAKLPKGIGLAQNGEIVQTVKSGYTYDFASHSYAVVYYDANGGEGSMSPNYILTDFKLPANGFTGPGGASFLAWDVNGTRYAPGDVLTSEADVTAKAVWSVTRTVSFDPNGGEGTMDPAPVADGGTYVLPKNTFTYAHKVFDCWEVNGERKAVGDSITVTADTLVKALWLDTYTVTYHINLEGKSDTYVVEDVLGEYRIYHSFEKPFGKSFAGWMSAADGTAAEYSNGESISVSTDVHLYAFYKGDEAAWGADAENLTESGSLTAAVGAAKSSSVGYVKLLRDPSSGCSVNGGTFTLDFAGHTVPQLIVWGGWTDHITLADSSADGKGGTAELALKPNEDNNGSKVTVTGGTYGPFAAGSGIGNRDVKITGGTFTSGVSVSNGTGVEISGGTFYAPQDGNVFFNSNGTLSLLDGTFYLDGAKYLIYSMGTYDEEFNEILGGTYHGAPTEAEIFHYHDARIRPSAAWDGFRIYRQVGTAYSTAWLYLPNGWYVFSPSGDDAYATYNMGAGLHIIASSQECIISYDANGGTGTMESQGRRPGVAAALPACGFTPPRGKEFLGWSYTPNGAVISGESFIPKGRAMTLYAQWTTNEAKWESLTKTERGTLVEALDALNKGEVLGNYITLLSDVYAPVRNGQFTISEDCRLDLNGFNLSNYYTVNGEELVGGSLVVKKDVTLSILGSGTLSGEMLFEVEGGELYIGGGTYVAAEKIALVRLNEYAGTLPKLVIQTVNNGGVSFAGSGSHFHFAFGCEVTVNSAARGARVSFGSFTGWEDKWDEWRPYKADGSAAEYTDYTTGEIFVLCNGHTGTGVRYEEIVGSDKHRVSCPCGHSFEQKHVDEVERERNRCDHCGAIALREVAWGDSETSVLAEGSFYQYYNYGGAANYVRLLQDIELDATWIVSTEMTIELLNYTISAAPDAELTRNALIQVYGEAAHLTIVGESSGSEQPGRVDGGDRHLAVLMSMGASLDLDAALCGVPALYVDADCENIVLDGANAALLGYDGTAAELLGGNLTLGLLETVGGITVGDDVESLDLKHFTDEEASFLALHDLDTSIITLGSDGMLVRVLENGYEPVTGSLAKGDVFRIISKGEYLKKQLGISMNGEELCYEFTPDTLIKTVIIATYTEDGQMLCASIHSTASGSVTPTAVPEDCCYNAIFFLDANGVPCILNPTYESVEDLFGD